MSPFRRLTFLVLTAALLRPAASHAAPACPQAIAFDPASGMSTADTGIAGIAHERPIFGDVLRLAVSCASSTTPKVRSPSAGGR